MSLKNLPRFSPVMRILWTCEWCKRDIVLSMGENVRQPENVFAYIQGLEAEKCIFCADPNEAYDITKAFRSFGIAWQMAPRTDNLHAEMLNAIFELQGRNTAYLCLLHLMRDPEGPTVEQAFARLQPYFSQYECSGPLEHLSEIERAVLYRPALLENDSDDNEFMRAVLSLKPGYLPTPKETTDV